MLNSIDIIPELNFWMRRELLSNSSIYDTYHKIPVDVSDSWRDPRSVIELLFNETFDPGPISSSSSAKSIESDNHKPYIYLYRKVNILNISDKILLNRIQPYRWRANIYAANSMKFIDIFDMHGSQFYSGYHFQNETILPYDIPEEDRSSYITYDTYNGSISNYPLWKNSNNDNPIDIDDPPIVSSPDIFTFTELTFDMLDKLWAYKTEIEIKNVNLNDITYEELDSCLAKLIYIYLDAVLNDSFIYANETDSICNENDDILSSLYEKHVLDIIYLLQQKSYGIIWTDSQKIHDNFFIITKKIIQKRRMSDIEYQKGEFIIRGDKLPWDRRDFVFFKDGVVLEQDQDYTITMETGDPNNIYTRVIILCDNFQLNELVEFIWSYADPYSAHSSNDN